ncbi:MAG: hypothetical protein BZY80_02320 [SAR202 cluster bacterium Io17-Chloro-G2]|nr:MAG: hypothetical protein BZY80_02320 [SAR202 cluster bacterium Io17-Chloro-G2]
MSLYFLLGTLTTEGRTRVHTNRNLVVEAARKVSGAGAEILGQYAVLGRYDYLMMIEADDNDAVARLSLEMGVSTGMHIETLPGIPIGFLTDGGRDDPVISPESVRLTPPEV